MLWSYKLSYFPIISSIYLVSLGELFWEYEKSPSFPYFLFIHHITVVNNYFFDHPSPEAPHSEETPILCDRTQFLLLKLKIPDSGFPSFPYSSDPATTHQLVSLQLQLLWRKEHAEPMLVVSIGYCGNYPVPGGSRVSDSSVSIQEPVLPELAV